MPSLRFLSLFCSVSLLSARLSLFACTPTHVLLPSFRTKHLRDSIYRVFVIGVAIVTAVGVFFFLLCGGISVCTSDEENQLTIKAG